MKHKIKSIMGILLCTIVLIGCAQGYEAEQTKEPVPLVIESPEPCYTGTIEVYSEGVEAFQYYGEVDIVNDGRGGQEVRIIVHTGGEPDE